MSVAAAQVPAHPAPPSHALTCEWQAPTNDDSGEVVGCHAFELALKMQAEVRMHARGGGGSVCEGQQAKQAEKVVDEGERPL